MDEERGEDGKRQKISKIALNQSPVPGPWRIWHSKTHQHFSSENKRTEQRKYN